MSLRVVTTVGSHVVDFALILLQTLRIVFLGASGAIDVFITSLFKPYTINSTQIPTLRYHLYFIKMLTVITYRNHEIRISFFHPQQVGFCDEKASESLLR